jgi:oxygen-independent coproporphyrinogen-3 oxidase
MTASLYIHIPFCVSKCAYCDFYSVPVSAHDPAVTRYLDDLRVEITEKLNAYGVRHIPSVYIGGGTPSILGADGIARLLRFLTQETPAAFLPADAEITVEANPDTLDAPFLQACIAHGVTRVSVGVQTFNDTCRAAVNRVGEGRMAEEKIALIHTLFPGSFSCDLISGLPGQTGEILRQDIETLLAHRPAHISLYDLVPHGTLPGLAPEDERAELWIKGRDMLVGAGYEQYEVSNFSLGPETRSAHNIRYWRMQNWIGAGKSASGTLIDDTTGEGFRETDGFRERLDRDTLMRETFLMGFRFCEGPDAELFQRRFGQTIEAVIPVSLAKWRDKGALRGNTTALNTGGLLFLDTFLRDCFAEIVAKHL